MFLGVRNSYEKGIENDCESFEAPTELHNWIKTQMKITSCDPLVTPSLLIPDQYEWRVYYVFLSVHHLQCAPRRFHAVTSLSTNPR